jgi:uncharacterized damage-inducible protein DinB
VLLTLKVSDLVEYTAWEREKWHQWLRDHGSQVLKISAGPNGDGRFETVGDLVRHIFSAEKRYVDRLSGRPLTDAGTIPTNDVEALFEFGQQSRRDLENFAETLPDTQWDIPNDYKIMNFALRATPKKIVVHVLMHEIRHWAQVGTLFRLNGLTDDLHDFLFSPVLNDEHGSEKEEA